MSPSPAHPAAAFFAGLLVWIGVIIAVLSGGCTLVAGGILVAEQFGNTGDQLAEAIFLPLSFGIAPFLIGLACVWAGRRLGQWSRR